MNTTKLATELMHSIRVKEMSIKRVLSFANIPSRNFYLWIQEEAKPSKIQIARMEILLQLVRDFQPTKPSKPTAINPLVDPISYAKRLRETLQTCCFLKRKSGPEFQV